MADKLKMLVVGAGRGRSHARAIAAAGDVLELVGMVDIDEDRLREALAQLGLPDSLAYTSLDAALDATDSDGIVVATWARSHEPLIDQALNAGKHVMVEKPFTLRLAPALELTQKAESLGLKIVATTQWRYMPGQRAVRRLINDGAYGIPQTGHLLSYKARGGEYPDSEHSQLWQMTVHEIDSLLAMVNQRVAEVYGHSYRPPATTWKRESTVTGEITFESGARFGLVSTSDARTNTMEFRAECERGAVVLRNTQSFGGREDLLVATDRETGFEAHPIEESIDGLIDLDARVARSFADWVNGGEEPETSARNHLQVLATLNGLIDSGETGRPVRVEV